MILQCDLFCLLLFLMFKNIFFIFCVSLPLNKVVREICYDHPLNQRNKPTKRAVEMEVRGGRKNFKMRSSQYKGVFIK